MATRRYKVLIHQNVSTRYASALTDQEFEFAAPHVAQKRGCGKKRTVDSREVLNAIFYRTRTGCQWRMLPTDFPAWNHITKFKYNVPLSRHFDARQRPMASVPLPVPLITASDLPITQVAGVRKGSQ